MRQLLRYPIRTAIFLLVFIFIGTGGFAPAKAKQIYYPPQGEAWEERSAEELGLNSEAMNEAVQFALNNENSVERDLRIAILKAFSREPYHEISGPVKERGGPAGVILKDGYIAASWGDLERVDMTFSVTKSYLSTVAGLAFDRNLIRYVTDRVNQYVWDRTFDGEHNSKITWEHLLNQTSDWYGTLFGIEDWGDRPPLGLDIDDMRGRELHEPGTHFKYNDVRVNVLAYSLLHVWREPLPVVLRNEIMDPIGASRTWRWYGYDQSWTEIDGMKVQSVSGGGHNGGGMFINTLDQARFGLLFARNGAWNGDQIISEEWIGMARAPSEPNPDYGYMWWTLQGDTDWGDVPVHLYYAAGFGGNYIVVDDENDLVIVTRWLDSSKLGNFVEMVYDAMEE
ncbi:serine hydrolase domain-containing protein [Rhodohalobacter sp. 8-1]|uniref:serine hydrolase domain-containing protein n=1 Tax=Rhodohalobacter sp. 8-1 TaxID=3131972 RepID=UPI0030ED4C87